MAAQRISAGIGVLDEAPDLLAAARRRIEDGALREDGRERVGLELEFHLVDLAAPEHRPGWPRVCALVDAVPPLPSGSRVTVEPGGQVELSLPPAPDAATAVTRLRADVVALRAALRPAYGLVALGADPLRPVRRIHPGARYRAMERHFDALGCGGPGRAMMSATAALQVNLDAGTRGAWRDRTALLGLLGPVLTALSATSSCLAGTRSGWHSMRAQAWAGIDDRRSGSCLPPDADPAACWADYALAAPVMFTGGPTAPRAVTTRVPLAVWLADPDLLGHESGPEEIDDHLTTLFPPLRPRGYLELRCLDAMPDRWWPALVALVATVLQDPAAGERAREACLRARPDPLHAGRLGLADPAVRHAARECVLAAADRAVGGLREPLADLAEVVLAGRTPGDDVRDRLDRVGAARLMLEEADA